MGADGGFSMITVPKNTKQLLENHPLGYIKYQSRLFFTGSGEDRSLLLEDPFIQKTIESLEDLLGEILKAHNRPQLGMHRLALLSELGIRAEDPGMAGVVDYLLGMINGDGIPESIIELPKVFGGSGKTEQSWFICDFPLLLYSLRKMGCDSPEVSRGFNTLIDLADDGGYRCMAKNPKIKGPGPRASPCPFANLLVAKALSLDYRTSDAARGAVEMLLRHWQQGRGKKYFLFGIGTDYRKLKFPMVWYNLLHVLDTVSRYDEFKYDPRLSEMADILEEKADSVGMFTPESIYMIYKKEEFSNKKEASAQLSLTCYNILSRLGRLSL